MRSSCLLVLSSFCCLSILPTSIAFVPSTTTSINVFAPAQQSALSLVSRDVNTGHNRNNQLQEGLDDSSSYYNANATASATSVTTQPTGSSPSSGSTTMSPCVRICRYNADFYGGAVCIGCFRETFEIGSWSSFTDQQKLYAYQDALDRCQSAELDGLSFPGSISQTELQLQKNGLEQKIKSVAAN